MDGVDFFEDHWTWTFSEQCSGFERWISDKSDFRECSARNVKEGFNEGEESSIEMHENQEGDRPAYGYEKGTVAEKGKRVVDQLPQPYGEDDEEQDSWEKVSEASSE